MSNYYDLGADQIFKADIKNIIRLAEFIGIPNIDKMSLFPDFKYRLSCAIVRWYKKNPQKKRKNATQKR